MIFKNEESFKNETYKIAKQLKNMKVSTLRRAIANRYGFSTTKSFIKELNAKDIFHSNDDWLVEVRTSKLESVYVTNEFEISLDLCFGEGWSITLNRIDERGWHCDCQNNLLHKEHCTLTHNIDAVCRRAKYELDAYYFGLSYFDSREEAKEFMCKELLDSSGTNYIGDMEYSDLAKEQIIKILNS